MQVNNGKMSMSLNEPQFNETISSAPTELFQYQKLIMQFNEDKKINIFLNQLN